MICDLFVVCVRYAQISIKCKEFLRFSSNPFIRVVIFINLILCMLRLVFHSRALGAHYGKLDADLRIALCLARLRFSGSMTTIPSLKRIRASRRLWRLSWLTAWLFCGRSPLPWHGCRRPADCRSLRYDSFVRMQHYVRRSTYHVPLQRFWGDVRREFMQRLRCSSWYFGFLSS
jgi:hypothetical protein